MIGGELKLEQVIGIGGTRVDPLGGDVVLTESRDSAVGDDVHHRLDIGQIRREPRAGVPNGGHHSSSDAFVQRTDGVVGPDRYVDRVHLHHRTEQRCGLGSRSVVNWKSESHLGYTRHAV